MSRPRPLPRLHLVTDDRLVRGGSFVDLADQLLGVGGHRVALHLRAPAAGGAWLFAVASRLSPVARASGALLIVNDRVDVAVASGADGVQLGARGLVVEDARALVGERGVVGTSVHDPAEASAALARGADFVLAGTLYASDSHPGRAGSGTEWIARIRGGEGRVIGIGGVTPARVEAVRCAGAHGVAVNSGVWKAERPREALLRYLEALYDR